MNPYVEALRRIPPGETRSYLELAAMAGRPGAARAAGRAVASCREDNALPWHRVVSADGRGNDVATRKRQLLRLRREGARPRARESVQAWAKRSGAAFVGLYPTREYAARSDPRARRWPRERVEPFGDEATAMSRGFFPVGSSSRGEVPLPRPREGGAAPKEASLRQRLDAIDWGSVRDELERAGLRRLRGLLRPAECVSILNDSTDGARFERTIQMLPKGYGVGTYRYYREPVPEPVAALRVHLYRALAPAGYPETLSAFWQQCRRHGQRRASSILIGYGKGGVNHPHRDVYGPIYFPFQALIALSKRGRDFSGGVFYVVDEDGDGTMTRVAVDQGDVVLFATRERRSADRRIALRHGMTMVTKGTRYGVGLVFHLAE